MLTWYLIIWLGICPVCKTEFRYNDFPENGWHARVDTTYSAQTWICCNNCNVVYAARPDSIFRVREWNENILDSGKQWLIGLRTHRDTTYVKR
jgi:hypothetical protein